MKKLLMTILILSMSLSTVQAAVTYTPQLIESNEPIIENEEDEELNKEDTIEQAIDIDSDFSSEPDSEIPILEFDEEPIVTLNPLMNRTFYSLENKFYVNSDTPGLNTYATLDEAIEEANKSTKDDDPAIVVIQSDITLDKRYLVEGIIITSENDAIITITDFNDPANAGNAHNFWVAKGGKLLNLNIIVDKDIDTFQHSVICLGDDSFVEGCTITGIEDYGTGTPDRLFNTAIETAYGQTVNVTLKDNEISYFFYAMYFNPFEDTSGEDGLVVTGNEIHDTQRGVIVAADIENSIISDNTFYDNSDNIRIYDFSKNGINYYDLKDLSNENGNCMVENSLSGIKYDGSDFVFDNENGSFADAVALLEEGDVLKVAPGYYDIPKTHIIKKDNYKGSYPLTAQLDSSSHPWFLPIYRNNITIVGVDENGDEINDPSKVKSYFYSSTNSGGNWNEQNLITILADNVTLQGIGIMALPESDFSAKGLEVVSNSAVTIINCHFLPLSADLSPDDSYYENHKNFGPATYIGATENCVIENNIFQNSNINIGEIGDSSSVTIKNNEFISPRSYINSEGETKTSFTIRFNSFSNPVITDITGSTVQVSENKFDAAVTIGLTIGGNAIEYDTNNLAFERNYWGTASPDFGSIFSVGDNGSLPSAEPYYKASSMRARDLSNYVAPETPDPEPKPEPEEPSRSFGGRSSSSGVTTKPAATVNNKSMGEVSIAKDNKSVTITPYFGFEIIDVLINGISVGPVSSYTFDTAGTKNTVEAVFAAISPDTSSESYYKSPDISLWTDSSTLPFADVQAGDWYYDAVSYAYNNHIFSGVSETGFNPGDNMTRAMFAVVLHRITGTPVSSAENIFSDVPMDTWYTEGIHWAYTQGIVSGVDIGFFAPESNITREQMAVMLYNYAIQSGYNGTVTTSLDNFIDAEMISPWAEDSVKWAVANNLLSGKGNNDLDPSGSATRAEVASVLMRFIESY